MRPSKRGGCQPNHATCTGAGCFDLASASATTLCRLLLTSDQISIGFFPGNAFAYAATTSLALSPKPAPNPARTFTFSATSSSAIASSFASFQLGDCSLSIEQMSIGTSLAAGAGSGKYGCCGRTTPSTTGLKPRRMPGPACSLTFCAAFVASA